MEAPPAPEILEAVQEAVKAGVFRRAGRLNPRYRRLYDGLAEPHSRRAAARLHEAMRRLGA